MTDEAVSPLRRRMIEDMTIRKLARKTQHDYVHRIKNFAAFLGRSPDLARPHAAAPAIVSLDLRCATPVLPIAIGRTASSPPSIVPQNKRSTHFGNTPPTPKSP